MNAATLSDPISPSPRPAFSLCSHFLDLPSLPPHPADAPQLDSRLASRATALPTLTPPSLVIFLPALGAEDDVQEVSLLSLPTQPMPLSSTPGSLLGPLPSLLRRRPLQLFSSLL
jgi:hypothetical protein